MADGSRILVVDDEQEIRELLKSYLEREGYVVDTVKDGKTALFRVSNQDYNLVILDIMLPDTDGVEVCRTIREITNIPIIMLTARDSEVDKVLGLRIGADDYITKPFLPGELIARVKAQLRRFFVLGSEGDARSRKMVKFGDLKIDFDGYRVYKRNKEVQLTSTEFKILLLLAREPGKVFTKKQIFNKVWGDDYLEADNNVMVHIRRLRTKIEDDPKNPEFIETVWGIGYRFAGDEND
ncbi:response regulator transcription factor [Halothermothrix orenii]|uniref:Stage 0 sporulation protein A homolog n=1 Tax=Halothermothrix orenii (strain H 168 / OCM 544 / DSM 9562) TaxID=373903 RepID=B8D202_HALOH|nr:response regulator transcription factor [Halothermothrix orenii]ACL69229.1 two component transcriptional regulator, winged helix family [Halothermothrix orenii H 168]